MRNLARAAQHLGGAVFLALFGVFIVQITARFVFAKPLPWTDELAVVLYLWAILWACAFMVPEREHVVFDLMWNHAGRRTRQAMRLLGHSMIGGLAALALPAGTMCTSCAARAHRCWVGRFSGCSCRLWC